MYRPMNIMFPILVKSFVKDLTCYLSLICIINIQKLWIVKHTNNVLYNLVIYYITLRKSYSTK